MNPKGGSKMTFDEATEKIKGIADNYSRFKVGKTGQTLSDRFADEYDEEYDDIKEISNSDDKGLIDKWEKNLIKYFKGDKEYGKNVTMRQSEAEK